MFMGLSILSVTLCTLLFSVSSAFNTCTVSSYISLSNLATTSFVDGKDVWTLGFCTASNPQASVLSPCSTEGFASLHNLSDGTCTENFPVVVDDLRQDSATSSSFLLTDGAGVKKVNVSMVCDTSLTTSQSAMSFPITTVGDLRTLVIRSGAACPRHATFCSSTVSCEDATLSCVNGVCFDAACPVLKASSFGTSSSAIFMSELEVTDCRNVALPGLRRDNFEITLLGQNVENRAISDESPTLLLDAASLHTYQLTTLLLDQSASVQDSDAQAAIVAASKVLAEVVAKNSNHFVSIVVFDGSPSATVVLPHTNISSEIITALDSLPTDLPDPSATNLFGAVVSGLQETYQMKFALGDQRLVEASLVLFTDGYDTANRISRAEAVTKAKELQQDIAVIAIGVDEVSDVGFLEEIASKGLFRTVTLSDLTSTFEDISKRLLTGVSNQYLFGMCVPSRLPSVDISLKMNGTLWRSNVLEYKIDASEFRGRCSSSTILNALHNRSFAAQQRSQKDAFSDSFSTVVIIPPNGAYFFDVSSPRALMQISVVHSGTTVPNSTNIRSLYLSSKRCLLSPYCFDGEFTSSYGMEMGKSFQFLISSSSDVATSVRVAGVATRVVSSGTFVVNTAVGQPGEPTGVPVVSRYNGNVDLPATIIFVVYGCIVLVGLLIFLVKCSCMVNPTDASAFHHSPSPTRHVLRHPLMSTPLHAPSSPGFSPSIQTMNSGSANRSLFGDTPNHHFDDSYMVRSEVHPYRNVGLQGYSPPQRRGFRGSSAYDQSLL